MNGARSVVEQIDLQKDHLLREIQQLQKQLQKQQKKQQKQHSLKTSNSSKKPTKPTKSSLSPRQLSTMTKSHYKELVKPAISETWKSLFSVEPYLYENKSSSYVINKNKEDYLSQIRQDDDRSKDIHMSYMMEKFFEREQDE